MQSNDSVYEFGQRCFIAVSESVARLHSVDRFFSFATNNELEAQSREPTVASTIGPVDLRLDTTAQGGLELQWHKSGHDKELKFHIDFVKQLKSLRSFPAPKQGAFNQALGKKTQTILDATGGWGNDAMLMATQGYAVRVLERNPLMALLLEDAFGRLRDFVDFNNSPIVPPTVTFSDSIECIGKHSSIVDCVYLDPMFPEKRKKSASANKQMQLLQWMLGEDVDAENLLKAAVTAKAKRVSVKRPDYATPLLREPDQRFSSKLVHYDVYLVN